MKKRILFAAALLLAAPALAVAEENWPQWRGPNLNGTAQAEGLAVSWSETENIVWKVALPSWSGATPAIWGDKIFLTSPEAPAKAADAQQPQGARRRRYRDPGGDGLYLHCLSRADGSLIWKVRLTGGNYFKMKQNMSSPSPVTDGRHVWTLTGTGVLACYDFEGDQIWEFDVQKQFGSFGLNHGFASSPLLYEDRLIIPVLHGMKTDDPSYLFAVDKATGKTLWRTERPTDAIMESPDSYATPQLLLTEGGAQAIMNGGDVVTAHDIQTGEEVWRSRGLNPRNNPMNRIIASCVVAGDMVYAPSRRKPLLAIRAGGRGDVTETHIAWRTDLGPDVPTPVTDGRYLYIVDDRGVFSCLDAQTGETLYEPKRIARGTYSASPILADGKVYATSETATTTVVAAGPVFEVLATNQLDDGYTLSTLVVSGRQMFMRTSGHLYCIEEGAGGS